MALAASLEFKCQGCGWCCGHLAINIAFTDIARWLNEGRWNILRQVNFVRFKEAKDTGFYFGATIPKERPSCSFLVMENGMPRCSIYQTRPRACRDFPLANENTGQCPAQYEKDRGRLTSLQEAQFGDFKAAYANRKELFLLLSMVYEFESKLEEGAIKWDRKTGRFVVPIGLKEVVLKTDSSSPLIREAEEKLERLIQWQS